MKNRQNSSCRKRVRLHRAIAYCTAELSTLEGNEPCALELAEWLEALQAALANELLIANAMTLQAQLDDVVDAKQEAYEMCSASSGSGDADESSLP